MHTLNVWKDNFLRIVDIGIEYFTTHPHLYKEPPCRSVKALKRKMEKLHHSEYVFASADKAANNVIIIWKKILRGCFEGEIEVYEYIYTCSADEK